MVRWGLFGYHYLAKNLGVSLTSLPWLAAQGRRGAVRGTLQDQRARPGSMVHDAALPLDPLAQALRRTAGPQVALHRHGAVRGPPRHDGSALSELGMAPVRIPLLQRLRGPALRPPRDRRAPDAARSSRPSRPGASRGMCSARRPSTRRSSTASTFETDRRPSSTNQIDAARRAAIVRTREMCHEVRMRTLGLAWFARA